MIYSLMSAPGSWERRKSKGDAAAAKAPAKSKEA
jgi:hypothetical protein